MGRFAGIFAACGARGDGALMPYITAGDPSLETTQELLIQVAAHGADIIEVGIPFSDPLLDGPVIQSSAWRALQRGATPGGVMAAIGAVRERIDAGLLFMVPYNIVNRIGLARFAQGTSEAGVDGVLITDLPPEESAQWQAAADAAGVETIYLLAPTSSPERIRAAAARATGFLYCISRRGVTGVQERVPEELREVIARIRTETDLPVAVGFGIATREHVAEVLGLADGAVVGSALVSKIATAESEAAGVAAAVAFVAELRRGAVGARRR